MSSNKKMTTIAVICAVFLIAAAAFAALKPSAKESKRLFFSTFFNFNNLCMP